MVATKQEELQKTFSERIPQLCLMDDEFFCAVFDGDIECTEYVLRIIMGIDNLKVKTAVVQKAEMNLRGRGARFDVLAEADGVYYDIEVQRTDRGAAPRRARFNSSILDTNLLNKGEDFDRLPETYIIFITERDVLKGGHHGSTTSSTKNFLAAVSPSYVVISSGLRESDTAQTGHPYLKTLKRILAAGVDKKNIYCTRFNGTITLTSDGKNFTVTPETKTDWIDDWMTYKEKNQVK